MQPLGPGDEFGGYRIEAVAGRGGMGLVYRARQRRPDRIVAIKLIAPELAADPAFRARFERESAIAAQIEHPNVEPVYEVGEADGLLYIAMRYVDGVDLGRLLSQSGPLAPERAAYIVSQVADALDAAHARGLVHRDIKPGNILVADRDHVYLTDFGLTKRVSDTRGLTATGMFVGTVDYIAPEQIEGRRIDARADVYALGCVLYEMLSGTVPFPRDSGLATLYAHVNDSPPPLQGVPAPLAAAVARAMAKRPADRFLSAGDLGRAVLAGAAGRTDHGIERTVATRGAAIADADTPTVLAGRAPTRPGAAGPTRPEAAGPIQPEDATATGHRRTGPSGRPGRFWAVAAGGATLAAVIVVGIVIAIGSSGPGPTPATSQSTPSTPSTATVSQSTASVSTTPPATSSTTTAPPVSASRATLAPATVPAKVDECTRQLTFGADGSAGPLSCPNGDLNVPAWRYYARVDPALMSLGPFATPGQVLQTMCRNTKSTIPLEDNVYTLAQAYYGWSFGLLRLPNIRPRVTDGAPA